jgi:starch-binding outer membrane protein, SusD/RagB family
MQIIYSKKWMISIFIILLFNSCSEDFLDRAPTAALDRAKTFGDIRLARQYQMGLYKQSLIGGFYTLSNNPTDNSKFALDFISDMDGHCMGAYFNTSCLGMLQGKLQTWSLESSSEIENMWTNCYKSIRAINIFIENYQNVPLKTEAEKKEMNSMVGEAYFLRAHTYFELVKRWGGVPSVYKVLSVSDEQRIPRASITASIDSIVADCNRGAALMDTQVSSTQWLGRVTKGAAMGLKARALLWGASPYWSSHGSGIKYEDAAKAALDVIDMNIYSLMPTYKDVFMVNFNSEVMYFHNDVVHNTWQFMNFVPIPIGGWCNGNMLATQEFVDCYEIKNLSGQYVPFDRSNTDHVTNMYNTDRRDPRFKASVLYNGAKWQGITCSYYVGGAFGNGYEANYYTGYNFVKWLDESVRVGGLPGRGGSKQTNWIFLRYADILLMYAEAQNQVGGPNSSADGSDKTALWAINQVRKRAGVSDLPSSISIQDFDVRLRNERSVELVIEDQRYFDLKRWGIGEVMGQAVHQAIATKKTDGTFTYDFSQTTGPVRYQYPVLDQFNLYPIPVAEITRNPTLIQNPGWQDILRSSD